jgi:hypothetical protein
MKKYTKWQMLSENNNISKVTTFETTTGQKIEITNIINMLAYSIENILASDKTSEKE